MECGKERSGRAGRECGGYLEDEILLGVVKLLGERGRDGVELGVLAGLDSLVGLLIGEPLSCAELELGGGVIGLLPSAMGPSLLPGGCSKEARS